MKKLIITTFILFLALNFLPFFLEFTNLTFYHNYIYNFLFAIIVLNFFYKFQKIGVKYSTIIFIALLLPFLIYNLNFLYSQIYYLINSEEKEQIISITRSNHKSGILAESIEFKSPLQYSFIDSLTNGKLPKIVNFYQNKHYTLFLLEFLTLPIVLLTYLSKYLLFRNLSIQPLSSIVFPFNYFVLINKFNLSKIWKIYLLIPIVNLFIELTR